MASGAVDSGSVAPLDAKIYARSPAAGLYAAVEDRRPVFYGYLRAADPTVEDVQTWRNFLVRYCGSSGRRLALIFHDWGVASGKIRYPGFHAFTYHATEIQDTAGILMFDLDGHEGFSNAIICSAGMFKELRPELEIITGMELSSA